MGRPSKLTPAQWAEVERRSAEGESPSALAREFKVSAATISVRVSKVSKNVREVARLVAQGQAALAELPLRQQHLAVGLAEKLRNISTSLASAAELGAATAHRLQALANSEVAKVDDARPMDSIESLRNVGVLTKLANDSAATGLNLLAANKEMAARLNEPPPEAEVSVITLRALQGPVGPAVP